MPDAEPDTMDLERLAGILDAYGAEPARWPEAERAAALALLGRSEEGAALRDFAAALDSVLDAVSAPAHSPELVAEVLAAAVPRGWRRWAVDFWPFGPVWQPLSGLAAAAVVGIVVGAAAPGAILPQSGDLSAQETAESMAFGGFEAGTESGL